MAQAGPVIMAVSAVASAGMSIYSATRSFSAAEDAERIGRQNAALIEAETTEEARRLGLQQERAESRTKARAAASGFDVLSFSDIMDEQKRIHREELDWLVESGRSRAEIALEGGVIASEQIKGTGYQTISSVFGQGEDIYEAGQLAKWWE